MCSITVIMFRIKTCKNTLGTLQMGSKAYCCTALCLQSLPMLARFIEGRDDMKDGARIGRCSTVKCAMFTFVAQNLWKGRCVQDFFFTH